MRYPSWKTIAAICFIGMSYYGYQNEMAHLEKLNKNLFLKKEQLLALKTERQERRDQLIKEIESIQTHSWIEWSLIEKLGVIPEGYTKLTLNPEE